MFSEDKSSDDDSRNSCLGWKVEFEMGLLDWKLRSVVELLLVFSKKRLLRGWREKFELK